MHYYCRLPRRLKRSRSPSPPPLRSSSSPSIHVWVWHGFPQQETGCSELPSGYKSSEHPRETAKQADKRIVGRRSVFSLLYSPSLSPLLFATDYRQKRTAKQTSCIVNTCHHVRKCKEHFVVILITERSLYFRTEWYGTLVPLQMSGDISRKAKRVLLRV